MTGNLFPARLRTSHQDKRQNSNYRRNGKLQACEPCRKGKLRCDHMTPTCGRCLRRKKPDQCMYHPAPLTKAASVSSPQYARSNQSSPRLATRRPAFEHNPWRTPSNDPLTSDGKRLDAFRNLPSLTQLATLEESHSQSAGRSQDMVLGCSSQAKPSTSSSDTRSSFINDSAVLTENELSLGILPEPENPATLLISQSQIDKGVAVLTLLKDLSTIERYIDKWFSFAEGVVIIRPMVKIYIDGLWSTWQKSLESQKPGDLNNMSEKIWDNTRKPVSLLFDKQTTPRTFCAKVTGTCLRWEVVGIILALVSLLAQSLGDGDPIFCAHDEAPVDRTALAVETNHASELCVSFCGSIEEVNDLYLWLLYENTISHCSPRARGAFESSKRMAALTEALLTRNLHQEIKVDENTPFFMAELRKRLFICAYANDKRFAVAVGKPPKLTRHYCRLQIPLDLEDSQLMAEGMILKDALGELDEEGWNREGIVERCTFTRLSATNALITEEILELSLGNHPREAITCRAAEIEANIKQSWEDLPGFLRINADNPWNTKRSPLEWLFLASIKLGNLSHQFLLQRTLSKLVRADSPCPSHDLLSVCHSILELVVLMVNKRDQWRDFQVDFVSILTAHGIPSAAVLAVELLHQERNPSSTSATTYPLHRSSMIQNLSVIVACLGSFGDSSGQHRGCERGERFLKTILDLILCPGPAAPREERLMVDNTYDPMLGAPLMQPGSDGDFVRWLDTMDWGQDNWIDLS